MRGFRLDNDPEVDTGKMCMRGVGWTNGVWLITLQLTQPSPLLFGFVFRPGPVLDLGYNRRQA